MGFAQVENGLSWEAPPKKGILFIVQVYQRVWISLKKLYKEYFLSWLTSVLVMLMFPVILSPNFIPRVYKRDTAFVSGFVIGLPFSVEGIREG